MSFYKAARHLAGMKEKQLHEFANHRLKSEIKATESEFKPCDEITEWPEEASSLFVA